MTTQTKAPDERALVKAEQDEVRADLERIREQLTQVLPSKMDPDRFLRVVTGAVLTNPKLMRCDRISLMGAILEAAQLGLEPTGLLGSAYLVPYSIKGSLQAKLIPGYRGLIDLARRSDRVVAIWAKIVRDRDAFRYLEGSEPRIEHEPFVGTGGLGEGDENDPGKIRGAYMVAVVLGPHGEQVRQVEWMSWTEIEAVRKRSRAADDGPWITDYAEMSRKTVVRRGAKYLPLTPEAVRGFSLDEEAEREASPPVVNVTPSSRAGLLKALEARKGAAETDDATEEEAEAAQRSAVAESEEWETCPDLSPFEGHGRCDQDPGHKGKHMIGEDESWPQGQSWTGAVPEA